MNQIIKDAYELFKDGGFPYNVCGGFALEIFTDKEIRPHGDFDIAVWSEHKRDMIKFLLDNDWQLYARFMDWNMPETLEEFHLVTSADDPTLETCVNFHGIKQQGDTLPHLTLVPKEGKPNVYTYQYNERGGQKRFDFIELEIDEKVNGGFGWRENPSAIRELDKAILFKNGIPYMAPEIILLMKTPTYYRTNASQRKKGDMDFEAIAPMLGTEQKEWLINAMKLTYPNGHEWLEKLEGL